MYRLFVLAGVLTLAVLVAGIQVQAEEKDKDKDDSKPKNIKEVMKKAHAADDAFRKGIAKNIKDKDFEAAATTMKAWVAISGHLGSFDPPKGEKADWEKVTKKYAENVKTLAKAVEDKDGKVANKALGVVNASCGGCHKAHKGK